MEPIANKDMLALIEETGLIDNYIWLLLAELQGIIK